MKIVQILPELNEGGVERGTVEFNREFVKRGHESIVISTGGKLVSQIENDGGKHITFDVKSKNLLTVPFRIVGLYKILKEIKPTIVQVRSRVPAWLTYLANKKLNIPFVTMVHGFNSVNAYSKIMTYGDKVICGSQFMVDHIIKNYHTPIEKIVLIPEGIDLNSFDTELDNQFIFEFKRKYHLENSYIISHIARITHWKDQKTTIKAFFEIKKEIPNAKLLIIGSVDASRENYFNELKELVEQNSYRDDIVFTGNQQKIKEILALSDVSISASNKPETFGRANIESIFMGTPLIATNIGATLDYVREGKNGFLFDPDNYQQLASMIVKVKNSNFNKNEMKEQIIEDYSLDNMVDSTLNVYEDLKNF